MILVEGQSVTMDMTQDNNSMIQVSPVLTYERAILHVELQISSICHMNCFFCIIIIILNSVIKTLYSTNNINIVTLLMVYTHCIKL